MKLTSKIILPLFVLIAATLLLTGFKKSEQRNVILTNKIILPKTPDTYQEVRYIVLRGTNEQIGEAIGDIAQQWLGIKHLGRFSDPIYAIARRIYMEKNYPMLFERMKGVAKAYGIAGDNNTYVTNYLFYDLAPAACSAMYIPAQYSTSNQALYGHNVDFYTTTMREMMGMKPKIGEHNLYSRNFIMELYPDKGYPSLVIGSLDLLNGIQSGINSQGILVSMLADNFGPTSMEKEPTEDHVGGLTLLQAARLILDSCATLDEAKIALINNREIAGFMAGHLQVSDRHGNSFIFEISKDDFSYHFIDNKGKPQVITNHAIHKFPDANTFPKYSSRATYNTFYRYNALQNYIKQHKGKFSAADVKEAMSKVYGRVHDKDEGASRPIPLRTLWTVFYNLGDSSAEIKFYLKDGKTDPKTGSPELIFSQPFKFKLKPPVI